ncbi:fibronectin type III domain-containing protein 9 isoform X1 [Falco peregrinus]|uniref:fibronectin type III domain-containing protein 9 isoform X1 n=2 Tax=Falco peregrinus TaxID=8954 RepID=UPI00247B156F|nr:fibronectin type III domain-containing protein 9 isoform X1 [Falco peregrinus]
MFPVWCSWSRGTKDGRGCSVLGTPHPKAAPGDAVSHHPACGELELHLTSHQVAVEPRARALRGTMNIEVQNISYTSATVSWAMNNPCPENYYHVMYRPNWNSVFAGYLRQNFHREERVPHPLSSLVLHRLTPSTIYVLCITCKNSYPSSNHCTTFHTLDKTPLVFGGSKHESTTSMWMVSSLLLLCFIALLAYGCLQFWSARCHRAARLKHPDDSPDEAGEGSSSLEGPLNDGLREELLEVPMTTVLMRSSSFMRESPYRSPHCFFSYKNSDDKRAILPQHGLQ